MNTPLKNKGNNKGWNNLRPAKKGEPTRNPNGRPPKDRCVSDIAREMGKAKSIKITYTIPTKDGPIKKGLDLKSDKSLFHGVVAMMFKEALSGNVQAAKELIDRIEGKAPQAVEFPDGPGLINNPIIQVAGSKAAVAVKRMFDAHSKHEDD